MRWADKLTLRLRSLLRRADVEAELDEELRYHFRRQIEENIYAGMTPEEARRAARLEFGGIEQLKEDCRDHRRVAWLGTFWQDLRYGGRMLAKSPGFTAIAVLSLALGFGANTAIFSVINAAMLRELPYAEPDRLVMLTRSRPESQGRQRPVPAWYSPALRQDDTVFEIVASLGSPNQRADVTWVEGRAEQIRPQYVGPEIFATLGVVPLIGRAFSRQDLVVPQTGGWSESKAVVISYGFWQRRWGGRSDILGQRVDFGETTGLTVVGVMPPGFYIAPKFYATDVDIWIAFDWNARVVWPRTIGRLRPGVTIEQAVERCQSILNALDPEATAAGWTLHMQPLQEFQAGDYSEELFLLQGAVALVLLIACTNVAGLLIGRAAGRSREFALRKALGAGRARVWRQVFAESLLLAAGGGILGIAFAFGGIQLFEALAAGSFPGVHGVQLDTTVLAVSMAVAVATAFGFGMFPALHGARTEASSALKDGTRTTVGQAGHRLRRALVATQVGLSVVLLMGSGLMINSLAHMFQEDLGFDPDGVLTTGVQLAGPRYMRSGPAELEGTSSRDPSNVPSVTPEAERFWSQALERLGRTSGVQSVGFVSQLPLDWHWQCNLTIPGRPPEDAAEPMTADFQEVDAGYFSTMGIRLLRGALFSGRETATSPRVAIVNDTFAEMYFPDEDVVGKQVWLSIGGANRPFGVFREKSPTEIIGVVQGARISFREPGLPELYVPYQQHFTEYPFPRYTNLHLTKTFVIRTHGEPKEAAPAVREAVTSVDPGALISEIRTMRDQIGAFGEVVPVALWARLLSIFAGWPSFWRS